MIDNIRLANHAIFAARSTLLGCTGIITVIACRHGVHRLGAVHAVGFLAERIELGELAPVEIVKAAPASAAPPTQVAP